MMRFQILADVIEGFVHIVGKLKQFEFAFVNGAGADHVLPVDHLVPILPSIDQNQVVLGELMGLHQREHFPKFIHSAESAWKNNQSLGHLREP